MTILFIIYEEDKYETAFGDGKYYNYRNAAHDAVTAEVLRKKLADSLNHEMLYAGICKVEFNGSSYQVISKEEGYLYGWNSTLSYKKAIADANSNKNPIGNTKQPKALTPNK